jgi:tetratricopeptide (TPR) repeat protein
MLRAWGILAVAVILIGLATATLSPDMPSLPEIKAQPAPTATPTEAKTERLDQQWAAVEEARQTESWSEAISLLEEMHAMAPADALVRESLLSAYLQKARKLVAQGYLEEALQYIDRAVSLRPNDERVQRERLAAQLYMEGMDKLQGGEWAAGLDALNRVTEIDPDYRDVQDMIFSAHLNMGLAFKGAGELAASRKALRQALEIKPDSVEARDSYRQVIAVLVPTSTPSPTPTTNKRIEVDISEQHFYAYEGDFLAYSFVCSTGSNASPTAPGNYRVLDKIPMAYASTWNLQMPYWLGVYWSGSLENGIHALPILSDGEILWDGYLGQRVSFGCIILSNEAARLIYQWADVGTPVNIRY